MPGVLMWVQMLYRAVVFRMDGELPLEAKLLM
jgi:hypothetical protein